MSKPRQVDTPIRAAKFADPNAISRICGLADSGEIEQAGAEVITLFARGTYGVSPFWIWLAARFALGGPAELPKILDLAAQQLATDEALRPQILPEWGRAFGWFVDNVRSRTRFHAKFHDQTWARWRSLLTASLERELEASSDELLRASRAAGVDDFESGAHELCALVRRSFAGLLPSPAPNVEDECGPAVKPSDEQYSATGTAAGEAEWSERAAEFDAVTASEGEKGRFPVVGVSEYRREGVTSLGNDSLGNDSLGNDSRGNDSLGGDFPEARRSLALRVLQAKLRAFERLAGEQSWSLAAMVARDIERELSQFDPVRYFPDYFAGYLNTLCEIGSELEMHMQPADSLEAQATERLYHADPERFLAQLDAGYRAP